MEGLVQYHTNTCYLVLNRILNRVLNGPIFMGRLKMNREFLSFLMFIAKLKRKASNKPKEVRQRIKIRIRTLVRKKLQSSNLSVESKCELEKWL